MNAKSRRIRRHKRNNYNRMRFCTKKLLYKKRIIKSKKMKQKFRITANWFRNKMERRLKQILPKYVPEFTSIWTKGN